MRTPRIAVLALFIAAPIFILWRSLSPGRPNGASSYPSEARSSRSILGFMYYNTPFSLFPPNAAISLTDDNSTSFAARPAAFGPRLAPRGLSGQLWVGSGFAEDSLDGNGELGCSDLPVWAGSNTRASLKSSLRVGGPRGRISQAKADRPKPDARLLDPASRGPVARERRVHTRATDGGTTDSRLDDGHKPTLRRDASSSSHADIQSIQEAAEIQGKIVLLMRGGCGFLEKVLWAQRRGAIAVIVGDNQKGGPLIQMFAHGDEVGNVTVPAVFTARTTAHLLSSLTQPGSFIEDSLDDNGNPVLKVQQGPKARQDQGSRAPTPGKTAAGPKAAAPASRAKRAVKDKAEKPMVSNASGNRGWLPVFSWRRSPHTVDTESRPPSSGRWVMVEDWNDEKDKMISDSIGKSRKLKSAGDDFVIGVQDWRDPDLVDKPGSGAKKGGKDADQKTVSSSKDHEDAGKSSHESNGPKGGSITPSSGEYTPGKALPKDGKEAGSTGPKVDGKGHGIISKLFGDDDHGNASEAEGPSEEDDHDAEGLAVADHHHDPDQHEGLWVTITPTSSASPFFDTLLVLVVSPLITLTVVYALLIVRARIRRRRWRAPKSVVDRLPVRTYHTVATSPSLSPRLPSPSATPTTPLLQHSPTRPRPRSRTTTGVLQSENFLAPSSAMPTPQASARNGARPEREKCSSGFSAEWRKYMGRQVECVVCLEEYVDGVSRVMSLPCGHEFHADCITPWLTTRRRTCPICKGDVVRSLARGIRDGPRYEPYDDGSDDDLDVEASGSRLTERSTNTEQGILSSEPRETRQSSRQNSWFWLLSNGFGAWSRHRLQSPRPEDRNR